MKQQDIIRSPVGPLAWEFRVSNLETRYPDFRSFNVPEPKLPEIRLAFPLPVPMTQEVHRFGRHGQPQAFFARYPTYRLGVG